MQKFPYIVLDTETGGLDPLSHSLLSIGLICSETGACCEIFVVEPEIIAQPRALEINHIDLEQLKAEGLDPKAACTAIEAFLDALPSPRPLMVLGHNLAFDVAFLRRLYRLAERSFPREFSHRTVDTHSLLWALSRQGRLPPGVCSSDAAFAHFGIRVDPALRHTALGDAVATLALAEALLEMM